MLFERFRTTAALGEGTGIGLYISRHIVELHGGSIHVDTIAQHGTTMLVTFPALWSVVSERTGDRPAERPLALVVDDEPSMRDIVTFALETQDFETCTAGTAEAAWSVLQARAVDLVVLDVMLPGMSGVERAAESPRARGSPSSCSPRSVRPPAASRGWRPEPRTTSPSRSIPASWPCVRRVWCGAHHWATASSCRVP